MQVRYIALRLVEWRAAWFSDPVERLRFLRHKRRVPIRWTGRAPVIFFAVALASVSVALVRPVWRTGPASTMSQPTPRPLTSTAASQPGRIWLVESNDHFDLYSNGLRVENRFAVATKGRAYLVLPRKGLDSQPARLRFDPAGIVFHTTESHIAPFEEAQNSTLRRAGEGLLEFVNRNRSYHFVIDRFGRVFRIVQESDYANHAGHSVWADDAWVYVNLNQSFFGVAFEAKSRPDEIGLPANAAQIHAARTLTDMLRSRYNIPAGNCVAHAQVSVNPDNMRAGYHTDWAASLPFRELGLGNNYPCPLPSIVLFGFSGDSLLADDSNSNLRPALEAAESELRQQAAARQMPLDQYREILQRKYREATRAVRSTGALEEINE